MSIKIKIARNLAVLGTSALIFTACQKSDLTTAEDSSTSSTIAVASSAIQAAGGGTTDSVYLVQSCGHGGRRDSVSQSALPAAINSYIEANYSGATFHKAFAVKNSSSTITGYVVVVYYNDKPVGLLFDSAGTFVRVLEQRRKR
jgi:hypothetical protein